MAKRNEFRPDKPYSGFWEKLILTPTQRRKVLKWTLYTLVLVMLSVIQDVLLCRLDIFGATTELVPCGIFLICLLEGMEQGSIFALIASVIYLFSGSAAGVYCIVFITALAVFATAARQSWLQRGFGAAFLCTAAAMVLYELAVFFFGLFLELTTFARIGSFLVAALLTLVSVPVLYPILKAIGGGDAWKE
jgi:hypothetical protein